MMSISAYGAIFIPVALWIFLFRPQYLVSLMVVASVFVAAPLLDLSAGDFAVGVKPYYFVAVLLAIRAWPVLFKYRRLEHGLEPAVGKIVGSLVGFWKWGIASAFVLPVVFKGMEVINPRSVEGDVAAAFAMEGVTSPLRWSLENLGQAAYLTLNLVALLYVFGSRRHSIRSGHSLGTLRAMITVASLIALLQSVVAGAGWSLPLLFFDSNPAYSEGYGVALEGVRRVNSTFNEASAAGGFLAAGALGLLAERLRGGQASLLVVLLAVVGLILTTATTGYATFLLGGTLLLIYFARGSLRRRLPPHVLRKGAFAALLVAGAVAVLLYADPPLRQAALEMTVNKVETVSFVARISTDVYSMKLLVNTYGLGTGLGSNRPSSFAAYLLSNVGVIGSFLFVLFIARFFAQLLIESRQKGGAPAAMVMWMLAGLLIAQGVALPDLSWPPLWGVLIAAASLLVTRKGPTGVGGLAVERAAAQGPLPAISTVA